MNKYLILIALIVSPAACDDRNKSGPTSVSATEPAVTTPSEAVPQGRDLFATQGPASAVSVGAPTTVELAVTPVEGFKINKRFQWSFDFHPHDAIDVPVSKVAMEGVTLDDARATVPLNVTAKSAGEHTLSATANFSICNEDKCELYRSHEITFAVTATDG